MEPRSGEPERSVPQLGMHLLSDDLTSTRGAPSPARVGCCSMLYGGSRCRRLSPARLRLRFGLGCRVPLCGHRAFADVAGAAPEFAPVSLSCSRMNRGGCNFGWHVVRRGQNHVRFLGYSGREMLAVRLSHFDPRRTSHGRTQTSGSGGADLSFPVAAHPLPRISSADNARRDLRRQKTSVQERSSQTRAPSLQNCASGPPKNPYAMRRYRRRSRRGRTIRT
jgi:hypothetical protein